ncbi:MAG: hypothetical protein QOE87_1180 [Gaiellales bacterium]|nr:hypothetical protein [Gaiellales bacterium]
MTSGFAYAIAILCLPTFVLAAGVAGCLRSHDDATRALALPFAYACVVICGVTAVQLGIRGEALTFLTVGPALVAGGYLLVRRGVGSFPLWPALGAGITLAILATPYRWDKPGVLGWSVGNDSVVHATYADALAMPDRAPVAGSAARQLIGTFAGGYPEGAHALLAAVLAFSRDPLTTFNPVLAVMMAFAAFPAYWLIRRQLASAPLAGIGAAGAAAGYLQFGFYSQGFLPQLALTALLFGALGLGFEAIAGASLVLAAMAGVTAAGAVIVYSAAVGVYLAPAAALALLALVLVPGMSLRTRILLPLVALAAGAIAILPELGNTVRLARTAAAAAGDPTAFISDRGNLPGPVDKLTILGSWIGPDYRVPYLYVRPTQAAAVAAAVLAAVAVIVAVRRRRPALPAILVAVAAGAVYVAASSSIYYTAKTYQVAAFPIACAVVAGAAALTRAPWRPRLAVPLALAGALLLGGVAVAMKLGIGMAARAAAVTPAEFRQLETIGHRTPRRLGLALIADDWTKALLPDAAVPYDSSFGANVLPGHGFAGVLDADAIAPEALRRIDWIVEPRLGGASRPPRQFRLSGATTAYRVWTRTGASPPAGAVVPLEPQNGFGGLPLARGHSLVAPATGQLEGRALDGTVSFPAQWNLRGAAWGTWVANPVFVVPDPNGGPAARNHFELGAGGRYRIALIGQPSPSMRIRVDGSTLPAPDASAPGVMRYQSLGVVTLRPGRHSLELVPGGGGQISYILALSIERLGPPAAVTVCVAGRRAQLAPGTPVEVRRGQRITACGGRAALLDRISENPAP